jgi:uncharacterized membrane protein YdfJ with MMPL/SSD domain
MMMFAEFGKFRQAGFAIPLGLIVVLVATLTFTPALLRLAGRWAFWPQKMGQTRVSGGLAQRWEWLAQALTRRPKTIWAATVAIMLPFALAAVWFSDRVSYNLIGNLPADAPGVAGTAVLRRHFPAGLLGPVTILLVNEGVDFGSERGRGAVEQVTNRLRENAEQLRLADLRSLTVPLGITEAARRAFEGSDLPREAVQDAVRREARERYLSDMGGRKEVGTRLELVLQDDPFSREGINALNGLEETARAALPADLGDTTHVYVVGATANLRDLRAVTERDRGRVTLLVLGGVLVILFVLLRRPVVSAYLILSVLFSYYVTLGVALGLFWWLNPHGFEGIDWRVVIFLFTILIAVGEDYNIFLMARVDEEERRLGPVAGVTEALVRTGPIISSCGLIMAGTFASLLVGGLGEMKQLGFALAFGVLLDTFVVRPILVPAFLLILHASREGATPPAARGPLRAPQTSATQKAQTQ